MRQNSASICSTLGSVVCVCGWVGWVGGWVWMWVGVWVVGVVRDHASHQKAVGLPPGKASCPGHTGSLSSTATGAQPALKERTRKRGVAGQGAWAALRAARAAGAGAAAERLRGQRICANGGQKEEGANGSECGA